MDNSKGRPFLRTGMRIGKESNGVQKSYERTVGEDNLPKIINLQSEKDKLRKIKMNLDPLPDSFTPKV